MVLSKIKIESFAKRYHMGTLGGKGLIVLAVLQQRSLVSAIIVSTRILNFIFICIFGHHRPFSIPKI